jgi:intracellular sulfur oxidation DsrE/DsrF family protein
MLQHCLIHLWTEFVGLCQQTRNFDMKRKVGFGAAEILPFSRLVVSGIGALVDLQKSGYLSITP